MKKLWLMGVVVGVGLASSVLRTPSPKEKEKKERLQESNKVTSGLKVLSFGEDLGEVPSCPSPLERGWGEATPLQEFLKLYNDYYLASAVDSMPWNGSVEKCNPGTLTQAIYDKAEKRINFFRLVNDLPKITFNPEYHKQPQAAAMMMLANNNLSHTPPKTWKCYSDDAAAGASKSCLSLNWSSYTKEKSIVTGFMNDIGESNYFCGHRRWLLYSKATEVGYGATPKTEAIFVSYDYTKPTLTTPTFIAYPWDGFVPYTLIFSKWSFSLPEGLEVDFSKVTISIKDNLGKQMPFKLYPQKKGYLDPTITWQMLNLFTKDEEDYSENNLDKKGFIGKEITVKVSNVLVNKKPKTYQYVVKIIK